MTILGTIWSAAPLPALGNDRRSRRARASLAKKQRLNARMLCLTSNVRPGGVGPASPLVITLTRVHPPGKGVMDDDGLRATFKHVRDGIADFLGVDDSPRSGIEWRYNQVQSDSPIPHSKAKWWAHFEHLPLRQAVEVKRTDELSFTVTEPPPGPVALHPGLVLLSSKKGEVGVMVTNDTKHTLNIETSIDYVNGLVRVVLR